MQKTTITLTSLLALLILTFCSCNVQSLPDDLPDVGVESKNWNTSMKLIDDPVLLNSHKNGQNLILRIENMSDTPITFPENFDTKVMTKNEQNWINIQNNMYNAGAHYLPIKDSYPLGLIVTVLPYIPNLSSSTDIRIIIIGYAENNDKELLGAYLDVKLTP